MAEPIREARGRQISTIRNNGAMIIALKDALMALEDRIALMERRLFHGNGQPAMRDELRDVSQQIKHMSGEYRSVLPEFRVLRDQVQHNTQRLLEWDRDVEARKKFRATIVAGIIVAFATALLGLGIAVFQPKPPPAAVQQSIEQRLHSLEQRTKGGPQPWQHGY